MGSPFQFEECFAFDTAGNLYIADSHTNKIRKVSHVQNAQCGTQSGYTGICVTTFAGTGADGTCTTSTIFSPEAIAFDSMGNLYLGERWGYVIRRIDTKGQVTTIAGQAGKRGSVDGPALQALLYTLTSFAFDSAGNLVMSDSDSKTIRKLILD